MVHVFSCWDISALLFKFTPTHPLPPKNKNKTKQKEKKPTTTTTRSAHILCKMSTQEWNRLVSVVAGGSYNHKHMSMSKLCSE